MRVDERMNIGRMLGALSHQILSEMKVSKSYRRILGWPIIFESPFLLLAPYHLDPQT
jgi:hypothetical protein